MKAELLVKLLIPDTTAITTFHTLERMGYKELESLERQDYYLFDVDVDGLGTFSEEITKVDILVNANKHKAVVKLLKEPYEKDDCIIIIVKDIDNPGIGVCSTLQNRLGFSNIKSVEKGVLWKMKIKGSKKESIAEDITKNLLMNKHYQTYRVV